MEDATLTHETAQQVFDRLLGQLDDIAEEVVVHFADETDDAFIKALIDVERQLEPQLIPAYGAEDTKVITTRLIVVASWLRREIELGTKEIQQIAERTVVTKQHASGRIEEFEKRPVFGIVPA